ncbi:hypothetical protein E9230_002190 [Corynebacterium glutamicum]|nr:hypothetical protein [Corynebacterium glutamicum]
MDMRPGSGGVNGQVPAEFALLIGLRLQPGFDLCPETRALPGLKQCVDPPPRAVTGRHIAPGTTDTDAVSDTVDQVTQRIARWPTQV